MNQSCRVCGEAAAGYHFGAFTCEGCKSFFGRTYNNRSSIGECKNNNSCIINKKNRTSCKSCRLKRCLTVGMSKSGSRYGRRSNWFKIHCLLQDQGSMPPQTTTNQLQQTQVDQNLLLQATQLQQTQVDQNLLQQAATQLRQSQNDQNRLLASAAAAAQNGTSNLNNSNALANININDNDINESNNNNNLSNNNSDSNNMNNANDNNSSNNNYNNPLNHHNLQFLHNSLNHPDASIAASDPSSMYALAQLFAYYYLAVSQRPT